MNELTSKRLLLWCITLIAILSIGQMPPISQDMAYHEFADTKLLLGIPNAGNVLSNIPFIIVGLYGLWYVSQNKQSLGAFYWGGLTFSIGVTLVGFGSGYYHWSPNNITLVWDRLPMTIGFMGLYAMIVSAFVKAESGVKILPWLVLVGLVSVGYWFITESYGQGDLRWYILVQFLPMILILVILAFFKAPLLNKSKLILVLVFYAIAKVFEYFDSRIFELASPVSGHSLKHIAAAVACYYVVDWIKTINAQQVPT